MFWRQFFRANAKFLIRELERLVPGPPAFGLLIIGGKMGVVTHKDSDPAFNATVSFVDADNNPTQPDNPPTWSSDTPTVVSVDSSADPTGLTAVVTPGGSVGAAVITVTTTDNDGTVVTSQGTVTIVAGEAVVGDVEFS